MTDETLSRRLDDIEAKLARVLEALSGEADGAKPGIHERLREVERRVLEIESSQDDRASERASRAWQLLMIPFGAAVYAVASWVQAKAKGH